MLTKWKANVGTVGAFLLALIAWLGFFGIDARTIRAKMTAHYIFLIAALIFTCLFILSLRYLWRVTRVTPENIHLKIRQWLDAFNVSHRVVPFEPWYFRYDVTSWGQMFYVGRPKTGGGRILYIELRTGIMADHVKAFNALSDFDKRRLQGQIALEIARARISSSVHKEDYSDFSITRTLPINAKLGETDFFNAMAEVYYGAMVVWNSIGLQLDKAPSEVKPPLLTSDTGGKPNTSTKG
jgi:hypothetical protein